jgi:DNA invertase Pin-like site-specific DNA recombinase
MSNRRKKSADARKVVGYVRVSTEDQNLGPDAQRAALQRWCASNGAELVAVHEDHGISGGAPLEKRLGLMAAVADLTVHGAGVLLVAKRDRLARDVMLATMLDRMVEREGARVQTADGVANGDGPEAALMRGMLDLFAAYERGIIRARTKAALAVKKSRGEKLGGSVPFGFASSGAALVKDPAEQAVLATVHQLRADGLSFRAIAERLNTDGAPARGARWHATTVGNILSRTAA